MFTNDARAPDGSSPLSGLSFVFLAGRGTDEFTYPDHARIEPVRSRLRAWVLAISSLAIVIVLLAVAAYRYSPAIGTPSPTALNYSVSREVGAALSMIDACQRRSSQTWRCEVWDSEMSGTVIYVVTMDGGRCWNARSVRGSASGEGVPLKDPASGCVMLSDQLRLFSRIIG